MSFPASTKEFLGKVIKSELLTPVGLVNLVLVGAMIHLYESQQERLFSDYLELTKEYKLMNVALPPEQIEAFVQERFFLSWLLIAIIFVIVVCIYLSYRFYMKHGAMIIERIFPRIDS